MQRLSLDHRDLHPHEHTGELSDYPVGDRRYVYHRSGSRRLIATGGIDDLGQRRYRPAVHRGGNPG